MIQSYSGKPCFPMTRGTETEMFTPARREHTGGPFTIGFVHRLTPEKGVPFLAEMERDLLAAGAPPFQPSIVGDGSEADWLRAHLRNVAMPGVLRGEALTRPCGHGCLRLPLGNRMFSNVVLEALASGMPAVVTAAGT
jgi:glycosyltransferase involved in cell wall biosynthesis